MHFFQRGGIPGDEVGFGERWPRLEGHRQAAADLLKKLPATEFEKALKPIGEGTFNTLSAAYAVLALKSYARVVAQHPPEFTIAEFDKSKKEKVLATGTKL